MGDRREHQRRREALERAVRERGVLDADLRGRLVDADADTGPSAAGRLASQIAVDSAAVSDAQVADVRRELGSDRAAFEVVVAASVGAALQAWDAAMAAIDEARGRDRATR